MQRPRVYPILCTYILSIHTLYMVFMHMFSKEGKAFSFVWEFCYIWCKQKATKQKYTSICASSTCMQYAIIWYLKAEFTCFCFLHCYLQTRSTAHNISTIQAMYFISKKYTMHITVQVHDKNEYEYFGWDECIAQQNSNSNNRSPQSIMLDNVRIVWRFFFALTFKYS